MKACLHCGKRLGPRRDYEGAAQYEGRKFCSHKCAIAARKEWMWSERRRKRSAISSKIPAPTVEEWLALNGGYTICEPRYAAAVEHAMTDRHSSMRGGRVR